MRILQVLGGDLPYVPKNLSGGCPLRVLADRELLGVDAGQVILLFEDVIDVTLVDVVSDRHGLVRGHRLVLEICLQVLVGNVQDRREPAQDPSDLARGVDHLAVDGHAQGQAVLDQDLAVPVEDAPPRRLRLREPHAILLRQLLVVLGCEHLQEPEAREEREEGTDNEQPEDGKA